MKNIPLTQDRSAIVDDEDYQWLINMGKWYYNLYQDKQHGYAVRHTSSAVIKKNDTRQLIKMHRVILEHHGYNLSGKIVDHANRNCLDNRKSNLRVCDAAANRVNSKMNKNNTSGYRGVTKRSPIRWEARIKHKQKLIHIGTFISGQEAARAYDKKAYELFGKFAQLNF